MTLKIILIRNQSGASDKFSIKIVKFFLKKPKENIVYLARKLGYRPLEQNRGEFNCVRPLLGGDYPRFHLFIKENKEKNEFIFNLHLDQKKPVYKGTPAHSGEYDDKLIEQEVIRIRKMIKY